MELGGTVDDVAGSVLRDDAGRRPDCLQALASRLAAFDPAALAGAKQQINRATTISADNLRTSYQELIAAAAQPEFPIRHEGLSSAERDLGAELELNLGDHLADLI